MNTDSHSAPSIAGTVAALALIVAIASVLLFRSPYSASNFEIVPDSVEYAVGGFHFAAEGHYYISVDGQRLPPRYPPWFSVLFVAPAYRFFGVEPGNAIFPVTFLGVVGIAMAFLIGVRLAGPWGGALASLTLLAVPVYFFSAKEVMTDVPCAALVLLACLLYLRMSPPPADRTYAYGWAGLAVALCIALRPIMAVLLIPFIVLAVTSATHIVKKSVFLLAPTVAVVGATLAYNAKVFGSVFRTGYHFWCPVPYDYPSLVFSLSHIPGNLKPLCWSGVPILVVIVALLWWFFRQTTPTEAAAGRTPTPLSHALRFTLLSAAPMTLLYVLYFYPDWRFYLPVASLLAVLAGARVAGMAAHWPVRIIPVVLGVLLVVVSAGKYVLPTALPERRLAAERLLRVTPQDAVVISSIEPVYLEFFMPSSSRRQFIPVSRNIEYASKAVARRKIPLSSLPPRGWQDPRWPGLIEGGARDVVPVVATENPESLMGAIQQGRRVYLDTSMIYVMDREALDTVVAPFNLVEQDDCLYELVPKKLESSAPTSDRPAEGTSPSPESGTRTSSATVQ